MKKGYSLAILALLGYITSTEAHKLLDQGKQRDWDDLLGDQSVFNEKGYSSDTPDGYGDVVDEVLGEKEAILEQKRKKSMEAARVQAAHQAKMRAEEESKMRQKAESELKLKIEAENKMKEREAAREKELSEMRLKVQ